MTKPNEAQEADLELLWGARAIAAELGLPEQKVFYALAKGRIPAKKVGDRWVASRRGLRQHFAEIIGAV